ncbi:DUF4124 domain-containing protein [Silanimonas sp.]|jgi:hypothetical protein|uniref:DUF4124 domain-containing protein n=1 Tax=Silanimonas sp. TaxID=1929290 RepID=UPI0022C34691|nr:DUF4124 domain-containing protein [Silanimonas sp.]MCZ8113776.1 DUF4124 domain-containing protein [Silanimonas sp.]
MRLLAGLITLFALVAVSSPLQAQDPVYTWVDSNGVRHYAQTPPEGVKYETRGVRTQTVGTEAAKPSETDGAIRPEDRASCERSRLALDQLNSDAPLQMDRDGDGKPEPLDATQRAEQKRLAEQAVRAYCNPSE